MDGSYHPDVSSLGPQNPALTPTGEGPPYCEKAQGKVLDFVSFQPPVIDGQPGCSRRRACLSPRRDHQGRPALWLCPGHLCGVEPMR